MELQPYLDAVKKAEYARDEKRNEINKLFTDGKTEEAKAQVPELNKLKAAVDSANEIYVSMRDTASNGGGQPGQAPAGSEVLQVNENDLAIGMSAKDIQNYSIIRMVNAVAEAQKGNPKVLDRAGLELEASRAMAEKLGRNPQGVFVPWDIQVAPMAMRGGAMRARNTQSIGDPEYGGYLKQTTIMVDSFIDVLRNKMVTRQAGVTVMTGLVGDIDIPKKTSGSTYYWIGEGSSPTKSEMKFGQVEANPRPIGASLQLTRRFLKQTSLDAEMMAREDLAATIALGIDEANLHGKGVKNQPMGIQYITGIGSVIGGNDGAVPDWADIIDLESEVSIDNADAGSLGYITNTKIRGAMKKTSKVSGQNGFIWEDGEMNGYPAYATNQVKSNLVKGNSGAVCSALFFGNWADLVDCFWAGLDLIIDPYTNSTSGDVLITALQDVDIACRRAVSFAAMLDAKSS
jgi:HK97 family phage major capsid protein